MRKERTQGKATGYTSNADSVYSILAWEVDESQTRNADDIFAPDYNGDQRDVEGKGLYN